jgi:hypothetical protein
MQVLPLRTCAIRMMILITLVAAIDATAVALSAKPLFWAAIVPALIPLFSPLTFLSLRRGSIS